MLLSKKKMKKIGMQGFSLIELMVTITIVVLVTGIVLFRYSSFNSAVLLNSQAYFVAFDLREAQSLAISVRGRGDEFREEYGIYFDISTPNRYLLFQDEGGLSLPQYDEGEEINAPYVIDPRFTIVDLCATPSGTGVESCYSEGGPATISVSFARPDFDAVMYGEGIGELSSAKIVLGVSNDDSFRKVVEVTSAGQIAVQSY